MSRHVQQSSNHSTDPIWRFRWFLVYLYAIALILSIIAAVIIALATRSPHSAGGLTEKRISSKVRKNAEGPKSVTGSGVSN